MLAGSSFGFAAKAALRRKLEPLRRALLIGVVAAAAVSLHGASAALQGIRVPAGFRVSTFARGLSQPTAMAYGPDGRIYVTESTGHARRDPARDAKAGGARPRPAHAARARLARQRRSSSPSRAGSNDSGSRRPARGRRVVVKGLPFGEHQQDNVVVGPDGRLYWGSGSTCDACSEHDARSAAMLSLRPDGTDLRVVARGLRNPYGLAFQPGTGRLYASVNGQDELGTDADPEPPRWSSR